MRKLFAWIGRMIEQSLTIALIIIILALLWLLIKAHGAPAPMKKSAPAEQEVWKQYIGQWDIVWCGSNISVNLKANGHYIENGFYGHWEGNWRVEKNQLIVDHALQLSDGTWGKSWKWRQVVPNENMTRNKGPKKPDA